MNKSKTIALSSVTTAICVIVLVIGAYFPTFDLSAMFVSSVLIMIPLAKNAKVGALLATVAASILTLFLSGFRFQIVLPFLLFFGLHPIVNSIFAEKNVNKFLGYAIKAVWFVGTLFLMYFFAKMFVVDNEQIERFIVPIIIFGGLLLFAVYDFMMFRFQKMLAAILERFKL